MGALSEIAIYLIQSLCSLYLLVVLLRFLFQWVRADFYNPISQAIVKVTNPPLKPLRRWIPSVLGLDTASLVLALLVQAVTMVLLLLLHGYTPPWGILPLWAVLGVCGLLLNIYFFAILLNIILSWVAPASYHPGVILLRQLTEPVMAPFRRLLPDLGGLDLSPILVFLVINVLEVLLRHAAVLAQMPRGLALGV